MSCVVKAHSASDTTKPPHYYVADESEVLFKSREVRSQQKDEYYHLSPGFGVKSTDETLPSLAEKSADSL